MPVYSWKSKPTVPGYYWIKYRELNDMHIIEIFINSRTKQLTYWSRLGEKYLPVNTLKVDWAGPIEEPVGE